MTLIPHPLSTPVSPRLRLTLAACCALALSACGGTPTNRLMTPLHQPVVTHATYTLDVSAGPNGLSPGEVRRLSGWFDAMGLRYGDQVAIDDPLASEVTRAQIAALVDGRGLVLATRPALTQAALDAGVVRVSFTRASATVPGCPDWSANSETNGQNALHPNFGCAVNSNLAAMVANPDDLIRGTPNSQSNPVATSDKAVAAFRDAKPSGNGGTVKTNSSKGS
jgi:pilus assembly protein CpaD